MNNKKVVALSYSALTAINRKVYGVMAESCDLELVIPEAVQIGNTVKKAEAAGKGDPTLVLLPLTKGNPRVYYYKGLWKYLRKKKPSYIFLENDPMSVLSLYCSLYAALHGSKLLCLTNENLPISARLLKEPIGVKAKLLLILKLVVSFITRKTIKSVFTINYDGKAVFEGLKYKEVKWVPLGYDPAYFSFNPVTRNEIRKQYNLHTFTISYFGRILPQKGVLLLLQALNELKQYEWSLLMDDFSLYATPYMEEVKNFIRDNNLEKRVIFFHANHEEIADFMNAADLAVVPSYTEGSFKEQYGRVVQEAVACGCMTIVSNSGFLPHFFNNPFFVFEQKNVSAIRNKIEEILKMPADVRRQLTEASMQYIQSNFSIQSQSSRILQSMQIGYNEAFTSR